MKILEYYDYNPEKLIMDLSLTHHFKVLHFTAQQIFELGVLKVVQEVQDIKPDVLIFEMDSPALHEFIKETFPESENVIIIDNITNRNRDKETIVQNITSVFSGQVIVIRDVEDLSLIYNVDGKELQLMNKWHKVNARVLVSEEEPISMARCAITDVPLKNTMDYYFNGVVAISEEAAKEIANAIAD